jgi:predicted amidohydrolase YtcJ
MNKKSIPADLVFTNARIYTVNEAQPWAEAVAINGNNIAFVGSSEEADALVGDHTEVIDLEGKTMLPGIITTHDHATALMPVQNGLLMPNKGDKKWMLEQLKEWVATHPDGPFYSYGGAFEGTIMITKEEIDAIIKDKPFLMIGQGGHGGWMNSIALKNSGVVKGKPDPIDAYGRTKDGTPTGEITASPGVWWAATELDMIKKETIKASGPEILAHLSSNGITASMEAMTYPGTEDAAFNAIAELEQEGRLNVRLFMCTTIQRPQHIERALAKLREYGPKHSSEFYNINFLKIHGDGAPENRSARMLEPYPGVEETYGFLAASQEQVKEIMVEAAKSGFNIHTHTIGDGATRWALNGFEAVRKAGYNDVRLMTGHTYLVSPEDKPRYKELDVLANTLSPEAKGNPNVKKVWRASEYNSMIPIGSFLKMGVKVGASADYPVFDVDPFLNMYYMMTRKDLEGGESLGAEEEKITLEQAIRTYTSDAAYFLGAEDYLGSIQVGKRADLIVIDRDIFKVTPEEMAETLVISTMVDGKVVFNREEELGKLEVEKVEVTNPELQSAIDIAKLNLLVKEDKMIGFSVCDAEQEHTGYIEPGSHFAPEEVNKAFSVLLDKDFFYLKPARSIYWEKDNQNYWIQWTAKDDVRVLWAFDPELNKAVEILQVRSKS